MTASLTRLRALALVASTFALLGLFATAAAHASSWTDETAMVNSYSWRDTFVADPGRTYRWDRAPLINQFGSYYRAQGFGNILLWAPEYASWAPPVFAKWAGCNNPAEPTVGTCPDGSPLHQAYVTWALAYTNIKALMWDDAFISLSCGNFSERRVTGPMPTISGAKFEDVNGNGQRDPGEPGLSGWTIQLWQNGSELASTQTDGNGNYSFALDANALPITSEDFEVREVQQPGWVADRAPGTVHVPFGSVNADFGGNDFGNYRPAAIGGVKYEDMAADGTRDAGDPTLPGWTFDLGGGPSAPASQQTDGGGAYAFTGLRPGTYTVSEELQPGWRYSSPADGTRTITVTSGETATAEFGNYRPATIHGVKFDDHDVDRLQGPDDGGLQDWTISLTGGRSPDATAVTDADGQYSFTGLIPGTYRVDETLKPHWRQTAPESGSHDVTVRSGDSVDADFGNVCLGSTHVTITDEAGGAPLSDVEVRIEEDHVPGVLSNDPALPITTTGTPSFTDLLPGTYRVIVFLPDHDYTTDPDLTVVDGRLAVVKTITVAECQATDVPVKIITSSTGKVTGGMKMAIPDGFATAGYVFMTRPSGAATGNLEYQDHVAGTDLHTDQIERVYVTPTDAWVGGVVDVEGVSHRFELHLVDLGEPGVDDHFELLLDDGYRVGYGETITGGNTQIHPTQ